MINNILEIYDNDGNIIKFSTLNIKYEKTPRSSVYSNILYIDDKPIIGKNRNTYKIKYKCVCGNESTVLLKYYLHKTRIKCNKCLNTSNKHNNSNSFTNSYSNKPFDACPNEFKNKYWLRHLHYDEFMYALNTGILYKINDIYVNNAYPNDNIIYYEHEHNNNQAKYQSYVSFDNGVTKEALKSLSLKCNMCQKIFKIHPFNIRKFIKKNKEIRCRSCNFSTITFMVKQYKNTFLTYQSELEKQFLDYCFNYGIPVMNGFEIPYWFNGKIHTYITDFYLPEHKIILEIKGCNPYFKKDLENGKIEAKNAYANNYAKQHGLKFRFIRDYHLLDFIKLLSSKLKKYPIVNYN